MTDSTIEKIISNNKIQSKEDNFDTTYLKISTILADDWVNDKYLEYLEKCFDKSSEDIKTKIIFSIQHDVPAPSVDAIKKHNRIKKICKRINGSFYYGQGIGYHLLLEGREIIGNIVISTGEHISTIGAIGALGIRITDEKQLIDVLQSGYLKLNEIKKIRIELYGQLGEDSSVRDVMLYLMQKYNFSKFNSIVEYSGELIKNMSLSDKIQLCNMSSEMGALSAIIAENYNSTNLYEKNAINFSKQFNKKEENIYDEVIYIDVSSIKPMCCTSNMKDKVIEVNNIAGMKFDQGFIGGCSVGIDDFRLAASLLKGKKVDPLKKLIISFPTNKLYIQAIEEGLVDIFISSGAILLNSGCGACWGGCQGKIGAGQRMISTANRSNSDNLSGDTYIASTKTVVKSCITDID